MKIHHHQKITLNSKRGGQILLYSQFRMFEEMKLDTGQLLLRRGLVAGNQVVLEFLK
jgi:hypothetical protein